MAQHPATPANVKAVLQAAQGGDAVLLAPGVYPDLGWYGPKIVRRFDPPLVITSADPANPAVLTNQNFNDLEGVTFRSVDLKVITPAFVGFNFYTVKGVALDRVHVYGPPGPPDTQAEGVRFFDSFDVAVVGCHVEQLSKGVVFARSADIVVVDCHLHHFNSDALNFGACKRVSVGGNAIHDFFARDEAHPDAMQFSGGGSDIRISGNLIRRGAGERTQGVFVADGDGLYSGLTIDGNVIVGTGSSAIRVIGATDVTIRDNDLVSFAGEDPTNILTQRCDRVTLTRNRAAAISTADSTNVVETGSVKTAPATDQGAAAIDGWLATKAALNGAAGGEPAPADPGPPADPPSAADPRDAAIAALTGAGLGLVGGLKARAEAAEAKLAQAVAAAQAGLKVTSFAKAKPFLDEIARLGA